MGEAGAAAQGEGLELGSDLGCSSIGGEVPGSGGNSLSSLRSLPSSALLPAVLPASQCNTPSKGDLRGGMENIHHLESGFSHLAICVALGPDPLGTIFGSAKGASSLPTAEGHCEDPVG